MLIREYDHQTDSSQLIELFDEFQDYLVSLDPLNRLRRFDGYGAEALDEVRADIAAHEGAFYVAVDDSVVIGFGAATITRPTPDEHLWLVHSSRGRITELYVRPTHRGKGIGKQLMQQLETHIAERGCDAIRIEVFVPNESAYAFYQALGYYARDIDLIRQITPR